MSIADTFLGLNGKTAIVTGGAAGIGLGIAKLLVEAGAAVVIADWNAEAGTATAEQIGCTFVRTDVSDETSVIALYAACAGKHGGVDIVVNNAGIFPKTEFAELTVERWDLIQAVNLRGVFLMMREAVKAMRAQERGGSIVNISSVSGERAAVFSNQAYGASKGGVTNLTRSCAAEFGADGIRVNAVLPGGVATDGARAASSGFPVKGPMMGPGRIPLGAMGQPADIARATLFFASDASAMITGQCLAIDGGFLVS